MGPRAKTQHTAQKLTLEVPVEVYDSYAERAIKAGRAIEDEMERTLSRCRSYNAATPVYLDDDDRNELSLLSGRMINTPEDVVALVRDLVTLRIQGTEVSLHHQLLKRLETRTHGLSLPDLIRRVTVDSLETFVGLR